MGLPQKSLWSLLEVEPFNIRVGSHDVRGMPEALRSRVRGRLWFSSIDSRRAVGWLPSVLRGRFGRQDKG